DLEGFFGVSILRLNIGPVGKREAARIARLLAGHVESVFLACRMGARMTKDELIEQLHEMVICAMDAADSIQEREEHCRELEVKAVTLDLLAERLQEKE